MRCSAGTPLLSVLLSGPAGCGKTALAAHLAQSSEYPFVRRVSAENLVGRSEFARVEAITKVFQDAYKSPLSLIVLDDLERLMDYVRIGPRFSNIVLQTIFSVLKKQPPRAGRRLLILATTSDPGFFEDAELFQAFNVKIAVPLLREKAHFKAVLEDLPGFTAALVEEVSSAPGLARGIGIRTLLLVAEMAVQRQNPIQRDTFLECLDQVGHHECKVEAAPPSLFRPVDRPAPSVRHPEPDAERDPGEA